MPNGMFRRSETIAKITTFNVFIQIPTDNSIQMDMKRKKLKIF